MVREEGSFYWPLVEPGWDGAVELCTGGGGVKWQLFKR